MPALAGVLAAASPLGFAGITGTGGGSMLIVAALGLLAWLLVIAAFVGTGSLPGRSRT